MNFLFWRRRSVEPPTPFMVIHASQMLYPQTSDVIRRVQEFIESDNVNEWLRKEAIKKINEGGKHVGPIVMAHW